MYVLCIFSMSHLYFALDVIINAIRNRFQQPDYETCVCS